MQPIASWSGGLNSCREMLRMIGKSSAHLGHLHELAQSCKRQVGKPCHYILGSFLSSQPSIVNFSATGQTADSPGKAESFFFFQFLLMLESWQVSNVTGVFQQPSLVGWAASAGKVESYTNILVYLGRCHSPWVCLALKVQSTEFPAPHGFWRQSKSKDSRIYHKGELIVSLMSCLIAVHHGKERQYEFW